MISIQFRTRYERRVPELIAVLELVTEYVNPAVGCHFYQGRD